MLITPKKKREKERDIGKAQQSWESKVASLRSQAKNRKQKREVRSKKG